jgi:hypothetical protein
MIDRVEYMKIAAQGGDDDGVRVIFTYDDDRKDTMELYGDDKEEAMGMLTQPGQPEILLIRLRQILRLTVH